MLSERLYKIGKKYNLLTKYNIQYDKGCMLNYSCALHINKLLFSEYALTDTQQYKLLNMITNLIEL